MAFPVKPEAALASRFRNILQDMLPIFNSNDLLSFWVIDRELKTLEKRLKKIQDVLHDAEWRSQTQESVSDWMDDLRELLYCIEDFVDDMNIERVRIEKRLAAMNDHEAAKKYSIGDIQGYHTSQKETISGSIKNINDKLEEVEKEATKLNLKSQTLAGTSFAVKDGDDIGPSVVESEIYGRQEDKDHVIELLMSPNDSSRNYSVVSIVGMGGVGKTTLARLVFRDVESHFDMQSWACVSGDFNFNRVVRELVEYISKENTSNMTTSALLDRLKGMVSAKKVLFVLDDMWTVDAWENLKGPFTHCGEGSKILVTTRDKIIGLTINDKEIYELQALEDSYCWDLFKEKAFARVIDERLERIGKEIVARCKGVPLAVKVIGSSLRFAQEEMWETTLKNKIWQSMDVAKDRIFPILKLSYHYLPSCLKRCFQYFAVFPTDYWLGRDNLVRLWIAEGLIESREGRMLEDIGCSYYIELQRRCIIQEDGKMHDLLHGLACKVSGKIFSRSDKGSESCMQMRSIRHLSLIDKEVNIEMFDKATNLRTLLVLQGALFDEIKLEWTLLRVLDLSFNQLSELPSSVGDLKHLRYLNLSWNRKLHSLPDSICELHNLQTLDLSGSLGLGSALPTHMGNLQNLRFLSLSYMGNLLALPSSIVKLSNLLTLDLNGCRRLTCIPDNIGGLQSLQRLWLKGCWSFSHLPREIGNLQHLRELLIDSSISCLPDSICNIRNLQVLDIYGCNHLNSLPRNIGNLTCIQKLRRFVVGRDEGHGIELLKDMNKLQGKLVISCLANVQSVEHALMANLKKKVLDEIHFDWGNKGHESHDSVNDLEDDDISDAVDRDLETRVLDALEPHPTSLKSLSFLNYYGGRIPKWLSALSFPILKELIMKGLERVNRMVDLELPSLERLEIKSCLKLKDVSMVLVPGLKELQIEDCIELKMIYVDHMLNLRKLMLKSLPNLTLLRGLHPGSSSSLTSLKDPLMGSDDLLLPVVGGGMFPILKDLNVQDCPKLKFSPEGLRHLTSLESVTFSGDQLEARKVASLQITGIANCLFDEISLKLTSLHVLNATELPSSVGNLRHLRNLNLSLNEKLQSLPDSICELHNLQTLALYGCLGIRGDGMRGVALPTHMGNLQNLRFLSLSYMGNLLALPSSIVKLSNLLTLDLNGCRRLTCIPDNIGGLQSLQRLWLKGCRSISHLPSEIGNLQHLRELQLRGSSISCLPESICNIRNLRVLDISGCESLNSLPHNIGNLTCIQKLGRFVVGREEGHGIEELKDMNKIQGKLVISCLANVQSVEHALMANLEKKVLDEIHFDWGNEGHESHDSINDLEDVSDVVDRELEARVLDALEPHPKSLKSLSFRNYLGGRIPKWLSALSFPILKELIMKGLEGINRMVDLELPSLEWLEIESCLKLKDASMGVPNLIKLVVLDCRDLTTLSISPSLGNSSSSLASSILDLPQLKKLTFRGCSSLRDICMVQVPGLEELQINDCKELKMIYVDHMPKLRELMLRSLPNLNLPGGLHPGSSSSLTSLKLLSISSGCEHELISLAMPFDCEAHGSNDLLLPEAGGGMFPILKDLDVQKCPNLKYIPEGLRYFTSLESFTFSGDQLEARIVASLQNLPRLGTIKIMGIAGRVLPLVGDDEASSTSSSLPPTLTRLVIKKCPNLTLLPKALHTIASLRTLEIRDCPELVSFPETGLPPLLQLLQVSRCKNLQYFPTGLNDHTSLRTLEIRDCPELVSFPETGLPPLLQALEVFSCKNLQYFPTGLNDHTSLQKIYFIDCEQVEARPGDGPPNFDRMVVCNCPKLEQQKKQHRKDWLP